MEQHRWVNAAGSRRTRLAFLIAAIALSTAACGSTTRSTTPTSTSSPVNTSVGASNSPASGVTVSATTNSQLGKEILVGANGRTLYLFEKDTKSTSSCSGSCATVWPPVTATGKPQAGTGISVSTLGTTTGSDGKSQVTYNGHPLYYYADDTGAGQTRGQGLNQFGALWYVVSPQGDAILGAGGSGGGPSTSAGSGGSY